MTLVSQYDVELLQRIEGVIGKKMAEFPHDKDAISLLSERVGEAQREAAKELRDASADKGGSHRRRKYEDDQEDEEEEVSSLVPKKKRKQK